MFSDLPSACLEQAEGVEGCKLACHVVAESVDGCTLWWINHRLHRNRVSPILHYSDTGFQLYVTLWCSLQLAVLRLVCFDLLLNSGFWILNSAFFIPLFPLKVVCPPPHPP